MQLTYTIEVKADFADRDKHEEIKKIIVRKANEIRANCELLGEGIKTDAAAWSDDWFQGVEQIDLSLVAEAQQGAEQIGGDEPVEISDELISALRDHNDEQG